MPPPHTYTKGEGGEGGKWVEGEDESEMRGLGRGREGRREERQSRVDGKVLRLPQAVLSLSLSLSLSHTHTHTHTLSLSLSLSLSHTHTHTHMHASASLGRTHTHVCVCVYKIRIQGTSDERTK